MGKGPYQFLLIRVPPGSVGLRKAAADLINQSLLIHHTVVYQSLSASAAYTYTFQDTVGGLEEP